MAREFEDKPATRERVPLLIGLVGPSGGGKTMSALRLATGIQSVVKGEIYYIDSEAKRALHYADRFNFRHVAFEAPFGPLDYLAAIDHCRRKGALTIVVDSASHEHDGPGGVLEQHAAELDRRAGDDWKKREKLTMLAWQKPKSDRRRLIQSILQMSINLIFCFRAKEKIKLIPGKEPKQLGWMPIAGEEFIYEMTVSCLLLPRADGVPQWHPDEEGEKLMIKLPEQFKEIFAKREPLSESIGASLAEWAAGGEAKKPAPATTTQGDPQLTAELLGYLRAATTREELEGIRARLSAGKVGRVFSGAEMRELGAAVKVCEERLPAVEQEREPGADEDQ